MLRVDLYFSADIKASLVSNCLTFANNWRFAVLRLLGSARQLSLAQSVWNHRIIVSFSKLGPEWEQWGSLLTVAGSCCGLVATWKENLLGLESTVYWYLTAWSERGWWPPEWKVWFSSVGAFFLPYSTWGGNTLNQIQVLKGSECFVSRVIFCPLPKEDQLL